ncbi:uncharacterized protein LOC113383224 [Ctenocephalides felis]|uniref:uncharacterized protein LOC113383224 n=1 Tax=Ctenocephalides felis TaxID=7515 RepID=UPI000E6E3151|nr:uncharacterized protein LOC113383224 [Ctenocephalides felis]
MPSGLGAGLEASLAPVKDEMHSDSPKSRVDVPSPSSHCEGLMLIMAIKRQKCRRVPEDFANGQRIIVEQDQQKNIRDEDAFWSPIIDVAVERMVQEQLKIACNDYYLLSMNATTDAP